MLESSRYLEMVPDFIGVCVVQRNGQVLEQAHGLADRTRGRSWTIDTESQIASISKQFAAVCVLELVDRGVLGLDDPVTRHLAVAGRAWDAVTVRHLLTHTSGMSHWNKQPGFDASVATPADERIRLFLTTPPAVPPGRVYAYSSPGYLLLSAVVSAASDSRYPDLVRELVIEPLGLRRTHVCAPGLGPLAHGYKAGEQVPSWDLATMPGTGEIWSTARDLARFVSALHTGRLLSPAVQPLLHEVRVPFAEPLSPDVRIRTSGYDAGHFVGSVDGHLAYLHPGDNPGYQSLALWLPEASAAVAVLSNDETTDVAATALTVIDESACLS